MTSPTAPEKKVETPDAKTWCKNICLQIASEAGEVAQIAGKTGCFGQGSYNPHDEKKTTNIVLLGREIGNLLYVAELLGVSKKDIAAGKRMKTNRLARDGEGVGPTRKILMRGVKSPGLSPPLISCCITRESAGSRIGQRSILSAAI